MFVQLAQVCFDIFSFRSNSLSERNKMYISMFMHFATNYVCPAGPGLFCKAVGQKESSKPFDQKTWYSVFPGYEIHIMAKFATFIGVPRGFPGGVSAGGRPAARSEEPSSAQLAAWGGGDLVRNEWKLLKVGSGVPCITMDNNGAIMIWSTVVDFRAMDFRQAHEDFRSCECGREMCEIFQHRGQSMAECSC